MTPKMQSVQCFMKKIRSKLPRRRRSQIIPILCSSPSHDPNASSHLTREVSCDSSRVSIKKPKPAAVVKKRGFDEAAGDGEFRRITRSYIRKRENDRAAKQKEEREVELSESSCVESCSGVAAEDRSSKSNRLNNRKEAANTKQVTGIDESEGICQSEISCVEQLSRTRSEKITKTGRKLNGAEFSLDNRENDVISVNSQLKSPSAEKFGNILSYIDKLSDKTITGGENRVSVDNVWEVSNCAESKFSESRTEQTPRLISADFDLACSEHFPCEDVSDYSSAAYPDIFQESSEIEFSSDYTPSIWFDSGSQFSERSVGDTSPSSTFQLFLFYSQEFCKSNFSNVSSRVEDMSSGGTAVSCTGGYVN